MTPTPIVVQLDLSDMHLAAIIGVERTIDAQKSGRAGRYGKSDAPDFAGDVNGCMGEVALAKHLDMFWSGTLGNILAADVGAHLQVRTTAYRDGHLLLHQPDNDDQPFVLAVIKLPKVMLVGWSFARDGKREEFWRPGIDRPCFFVPQQQLRPIAELRSAA